MNWFTSVFVALLGSLMMLAGPAAQAADKPPVFSDMSLQQAREKAGGEKLVLVDATAEWCPPCQLMDRTTWVDERLVNWLEANAIAIQLDVDEQRELARELGIRAMPTMIVYRDGEEVDRIVGYRDADAMLEWLEGIKKGDAAVARQAEQRTARGQDQPMHEPVPGWGRARELLDAGQYEEATEAYVALWERTRRTGPWDRRQLLIGDVHRLLEEHEPARQRFEELRDEVQARLEEQPTRRDLGNWLMLNLQVLEDHDPVLAWAERIGQDEAGQRTLQRHGLRLRPVFEQHDRLDLLGAAQANPLLQARVFVERLELLQSPEGMGVLAMMEEIVTVREAMEMEVEQLEDAQFQAEVRQSAQESFEKDVTRLYVSLLAAGRDEEGAEIGAFVLQKVDTPEMRIALVRTALEHEQARPEHLQWLEEAREQQWEGERAAEEMQMLIQRAQEALDR
jgi:thioredoxin 1